MPRRLGLALCALLACLGLATCDDPWLAGQGPSWLPLVQASFDLRAAFGGEQVGVAALERLNLGGTDYVFALTGKDPMALRLYILDAETLDFRYSLEQPYPSFNKTLMLGADGKVRCGNKTLDASLNLGDPAGLTVKDRVVKSDGVDNYEFESTELSVGVRKFPAAWTTPTTGSAPYDSSGLSYMLIDAEYFRGDPIGPSRILVRRDMYIWAGGHLSFDNVRGGAVVLGVDERTGPVSAFKEGGWLTADGLIGGTDSDKDEGLARYAYGSGELLDSIPMRDTHSSAIFFDPDGEHWYVYDDWSGRLYMLRTWWQ